MTLKMLTATQISKQYAGTLALDKVDFDIGSGEILGLIGENGAGKSTLMRIMCGIEQPTSGQLTIQGRPIHFAGPHEAQAQGIAMIPQEVLLVDDLSVVENIFLGHERVTKYGKLCKQQMRHQTRQILKELDSDHISEDQLTGLLPKGAQQMVAIARRMIQGGEVFVMDEPTASLTPEETKALFRLLKKLKQNGKSSVFISHRLEEMLEICDRIIVLRDGVNVGNFKNDGSLTKDLLVTTMVGNAVADEFARTISSAGTLMLETRALEMTTFQGKKTPPISLKAHAGEVVGITGLAGVGKTELAHVLSGLRPTLAGEILVKGETVSLASPVEAFRHHIGLVSEDRRGQGLVLGLSALANMTLTSLKKVTRFGSLHHGVERRLGMKLKDTLRLRAEYLDRQANLLSGGNQQKVVIMRQICSETEILLLDEPTKGIDIGAKSEVYRLIGELVAGGKAAVLLSSEPQEILGVCDKIYVLTPQGFLGPYLKNQLAYADLMALEFGTETSDKTEGRRA